MPDLACSKCGKRLSKKRARLVNGKVLCSPCVFPPMRQSGETRSAKTA